MNHVCITGYLLKDAVEAYTKNGVLKLVCDAMVDNGKGEHVPYRCDFEAAAIIVRVRPYLTSGRPFVFRAALDGYMYEEHGIKKHWVRYLRIDEAEFPARTLTKEPEKEKEDAA
jgi:hypothetical protein